MSYQGTGHAAQNPVTGEARAHTTQTGAAIDQGFQDLKTKVPGTVEYNATHPTTRGNLGQQAGTTGYGGTTGTTGYTTTGAAGTTGTGQAHFVENPATGELNKHSTKAGAKMDEAWQKTKAAIPGTQAHAATHPKTTNM